jgi:hypothetical protein
MSVHVLATEPNNGNSTVPASKISTTEMMDVDKEPVTKEFVNDNRHDDESSRCRSANTSPQRSVTPISPTTVPVNGDDGFETEAAKKRDLHGNESIGPVTRASPPSPRMLQAYIQESKDYLSGVSDLQIWKDLVDIWVQFEKNCPQRGVSWMFSPIL